MRLNFSMLSNSIHKRVGQDGTGGTASAHAVPSRPTIMQGERCAVGQHANAIVADADMSRLSHAGQSAVGRGEVAWIKAVPLVPFVPSINGDGAIDMDAFEERAAILEYHCGLSRAQAEQRAAAIMGISVKVGK